MLRINLVQQTYRQHMMERYHQMRNEYASSQTESDPQTSSGKGVVG
jgi:hypothetical protein